MKNSTNLINKIFLGMFLCAALIAPNAANAQFNKLKDKIKKTVTTSSDGAQQTIENSTDSKMQNRDVEETIENAEVYYLTQVERFDPHYYSVEQVKREAKEHAAKVEAALKTAPSYRTRKIGTYLRNETIEMTAAELVEKLNRAEEIISGNQADQQAQNMSYFLQGDVDDWRNRMNRLEDKDGFILIANHEYKLVFDRAAGEREELAKYSKGNGGKPLPASVITPLHNQIDELLAKMNSLASGYSFSGGAKPVEANIAGYVKTQAAGNIPGAMLVKTAWLPGEWMIDKNELDIPTMRSRLGTALYRVPNQKNCVEQHFFYEEKYAGGGRYQRASDVNFSDLRFVKCQ